jgi:hypothetical protein
VRSRVCALALVCGGCDLVFGVGGDQEPCSLESFETVAPVDVTTAEMFSVDWDQRFAVLLDSGIAYEHDLATGTRTSFELTEYSPTGLSLIPEGVALFYTAQIEPPELRGALRASASQWHVAPAVPAGMYAGTPSADAIGPRRVLVKMQMTDPTVQEYEDVAGRWMPVGEPHPVASQLAPNLTPNGLTMVFSGVDALGNQNVFAAVRDTIDDWFGDPVVIYPGAYASVQLVDQCRSLYAGDGTMVRRLDR